MRIKFEKEIKNCESGCPLYSLFSLRHHNIYPNICLWDGQSSRKEYPDLPYDDVIYPCELRLCPIEKPEEDDSCWIDQGSQRWDQLCEDLGVKRKIGESDSTLKKRALSYIKNLGRD